MKQHRNVGSYPVSVESGRTVAPGELVELPERLSAHDRSYVDSGVLVELPDNPPSAEEIDNPEPAAEAPPADTTKEVKYK